MNVRGMRRRVAILIDAIEDDYQAGIVRGAAQASEQADVQLVCVAGGVVGDAQKDPRSLRNFLFDVFDPRSVEGMLVLSGALGNQIGIERFTGWLARFGSVPLVNLGVDVPSLPSISVHGGASGIRDVMVHLIETHHHRRIAFVRGPESSCEAEDRYEAYRRALVDGGFEPDPNLVVEGTWLRESGAAAVRELFDNRKLHVKAVGAIACANDYMALGALEALRDRGIVVPSDIALTGFDDVDATRTIVPPLTTVRQPTQALGREGLRRLLALIARSDEPVVSKLEVQVVRRRSCGCTRIEMPGTVRPDVPGARSLEAALVARRALICAELARGAHGALFGAGQGWEERLVMALSSDVSGDDSSALVGALDQIMYKLKRAGGDLSACHGIVSLLRREVRDCATGQIAALARSDDVLDAARELVGEWLLREEISRRVSTLQHLREFSQVASLLLGSASPAVLKEQLENGFRALGIPAMSIGLFTEPGRVTANCQCITAYGPERFRTPSTFTACDYGPPEAFANVSGTLLLQPLLFEGAPLGIATTVLGNLDASVHQQMAEILSTGLQGFRAANSGPRGS
jgi:phosphoserine phosphatase RsbU/P